MVVRVVDVVCLVDTSSVLVFIVVTPSVDCGPIVDVGISSKNSRSRCYKTFSCSIQLSRKLSQFLLIFV